MKKYQSFSSENFHVLVVKLSIVLKRRVFVMSIWRQEDRSDNDKQLLDQ